MKKLISIILSTLILCTAIDLSVFTHEVYALGTSVVDVTGLGLGTGDAHVCNNYSVSKYDANYHWKECNICRRILTAKQAHSYIKSGSDSCVWNNPGQVQSCSCGYSKLYKKDHVLKKNPNGSLVWIHSSDHNWDYNVCEICGTGNINATRCVTTSSVLLGCGHAGKCKLCGTSFTGAHTEHGNSTSGYCSSWCQERYFAAVTANDYTCTRLGDNSFRIAVTLHGTGNSRYTDAVFLSAEPCISDAFTCSNFSVRKTADKTYVLQQDVTCTDPTTRNNNYLRLRWQFTKDFKHGSENLDICTNADWTAPTITAANVVYTGSNSGFATKCNLNVSATDNLNNGYNICYVRVLSADRKTVIRDWTAMNKLSNVSYYSSLDYIDEVSGSKNVIVQVRDAQTYKYNISEKVITIANLDSKSATVTTPTSSAKTWSKTKSVDFTVTDVGSGNVSISWQGAGNYVTMNKSGNTYSAPYTFTGNVYNFVKCTVNFRDRVSNVTSWNYDIYYLDNTTPTLTLSETKNHGNSVVTVTADDYCSAIKAQGSGKTADGAGKYGFYYGISTTNNSNNATWTSLQTNSTHADTITYNTYYFWVKDYAGNISQVKSIKTNPYWNVTYNQNNPNTTNNIGSMPSNQTKWAQSNLVLSSNKPTKQGYVFLNWNTKADGSGVTYNPSSTYNINADLVLYAQWKPNEYKVYYDKGLSSDLSTSIADATRNTNIQASDTNRPYTNAIYDKNLTFARIGSLKGRVYELNFDSNKPLSISKQKQNNDVNPSQIVKVTGNLPSKNTWKITGQDSGITSNLDVEMGSTVSKPNYKANNNTSVVATAQWNNKLLNNFGSPLLDGWKFVGWYDNQAGANSTPVNNTTDMIRSINTSINTSPNLYVNTKNNVVSYTVQPNITNFNQTLYARWQRTIKLTFNMNGGTFKGDTNNIDLIGVYYTNSDGYNFSLNGGYTGANLPNYEKQIGNLDIYGAYDANGKNTLYSKRDADGTEYRFLGWSLQPDSIEPDAEFIVYDTSHKLNYRIYDDTILYAVWEPILSVNTSLERTLGTTNSTIKQYDHKENLIATDSPYVAIESVVKPGEQGMYTLIHSNLNELNASDNLWVKVKFYSIGEMSKDDYIGEYWYDNLNEWDPVESQGTKLDRYITDIPNTIRRKFWMPVYIGSGNSDAPPYSSQVYPVWIQISQYSYYYKNFVPDKEREFIDINYYIYISDGGFVGSTEPDTYENTLAGLKTRVITN